MGICKHKQIHKPLNGTSNKQCIPYINYYEEQLHNDESGPLDGIGLSQKAVESNMQKSV